MSEEHPPKYEGTPHERRWCPVTEQYWLISEFFFSKEKCDMASMNNLNSNEEYKQFMEMQKALNY